MEPNHAVVIVGGGPTGLMLAAELALAKVDVAIVERREGQELLGTRARGVNARTIEVLDQRGVAERFLARGQALPIYGFASVPLDVKDLPTRHPYGLALVQRHIEELLAAWVVELGVPTIRGCAVTGFAQDEAGVDVALSDGRTLRAAYLVGCDGGRSTIRKQAGIEFAGWDASTSYLLAEVRMRDAPAFGFRRTEKAMAAIGPHEQPGYVGVVLQDERVVDAEPTLDEVRTRLVEIYGTDFGVHDPKVLSRFSDATRQAASYRDRRVLLAGDAAHVHSPIGGQGLNMGIQDAVNLGWKLAEVVHGTSPDALLDTYQAERHPVGARVLRVTMAQTAFGRGDERSKAAQESVAELLRMDEPRRRYGAMLAGLDIHYDLGPGHPLLGRRMPDLDLVTDAGPTRVFTLLHAARPVLLDFAGGVDGAIRARYDGAWELPVIGAVPAPSAVRIRPDGHVAWVAA